MRSASLVLLTLALLSIAAPAEAAHDPDHTGACTGDPHVVGVCGCPQGFWGITVYVHGDEKSFVCFF